MDIRISEDDMHLLSELKNVILVILTIIDLVFIFLSTVYSFNFKVDNLFADYDFLVCLLLFIDLIYEFYTTDRSLKEFFIDDKNIISLISLFPFDLIFRYFSIFRMFRFLKILKVVRIWNVKKDMNSLVYFIQHHLLKLLTVVLFIYLALSTILLYILDGAFTNIADAFWFNIITITTVGFGELTPASPIGRALSMLTIIIGIIFVAILTAYLSAIYNEKPEMETRKAIKKEVNNMIELNKNINYQLNELNKKIDQLENENRELKDKLVENNKKLEKIMEKN